MEERNNPFQELENFLLEVSPKEKGILDNIKAVIDQMIQSNHYYLAKKLQFSKSPLKKIYHRCFFNSGYEGTSHYLLNEINRFIFFFNMIKKKPSRAKEKLSDIREYIHKEMLPNIKKIRERTYVTLASSAPVIHRSGLYPNKTESYLEKIDHLIKDYFAKQQKKTDNNSHQKSLRIHHGCK